MSVQVDEDRRTLQAVEADIEQVQAASDRLIKERERLDGELLGSTNEGALLEAALSGKSLATSAKVRKASDRLSEIDDMLTALTNRRSRLELERVNLREAALADELTEAGEKVMRLREAEEKARQERITAENEYGFRHQETHSLREQRRHLEDKLWQNDPAYREVAVAERQRRREANAMTEEQIAAYRKQQIEAAGGVVIESEEDLKAVRRAAAEQGAKLTIFG